MSNGPDNPKYTLRLYVSGHLGTGQRAADNVSRLCVDALGVAAFTLEVIDVRERPELAERDKVLATPTLIRQSPPPPRRVIGDFNDAFAVLSALGIAPATPASVGGARQ